jgi:hypothetical protein
MTDGWIIVQPDVYVSTVIEPDSVTVRSIANTF